MLPLVMVVALAPVGGGGWPCLLFLVSAALASFGGGGSICGGGCPCLLGCGREWLSLRPVLSVVVVVALASFVVVGGCPGPLLVVVVLRKTEKER